jgi:hypothetical protein
MRKKKWEGRGKRKENGKEGKRKENKSRKG